MGRANVVELIRNVLEQVINYDDGAKALRRVRHYGASFGLT
jgi:hypothetical protein